MSKELLSPLVSVEVLPAKFGEKCLVPAQWHRHIFAREWQDMLSTLRVSKISNFIKDIPHTGFFFPYLCTSRDDPLRQAEENYPEYEVFTKYALKKKRMFVSPPTGFDAILVGDPIRGVIPAPMVSSCYFSPPPPNSPIYEDLDLEKYAFYSDTPTLTHSMEVYNPSTGFKTYYYTVDFVETRDNSGNIIAFPVLAPIATEVNATIAGVSGTYLLLHAIGTDVWEAHISKWVSWDGRQYVDAGEGGVVTRKTLLEVAYRNTQLMLQHQSTRGATFLPLVPGATGALLRRVDLGGGKYGWPDYIYDSLTQQPVLAGTGNSYSRYTLKSYVRKVGHFLPPDPSFMFVLQLATPENQLYHLYSHTSVFRIFWGGHYMLEFLPSAGGVGSARFYFFPLGYEVPLSVLDGVVPPVDKFALVGGQRATLAGLYELFHIQAFLPKPKGESYEFPWVYRVSLNEMDVWSLSRITPGASAEAFYIATLKGHICIFRYSDIERATKSGEEVRPIFAFNPLEFVRRNFGGTPLGELLIRRFSYATVPPDSDCWIYGCNVNAYFSMCDFVYRGYSISTMPTLISPDIDLIPAIMEAERQFSDGVFYYNPYVLSGTEEQWGVGKLDAERFFHIPQVPWIEPQVPKATEGEVKTPLVQKPVVPLVHFSMSPAAWDYWRAAMNIPPFFAVCYKETTGLTIQSAPVSTIVAIITSPACQVRNPYRSTTSPPLFNGVVRTRQIVIGEDEEESYTHWGGVIPSLDMGYSPAYFPNWESYLAHTQALVNTLQHNPIRLVDGEIRSFRFPMSPPVLHACDIVTSGVFSIGDKEWRNAIDLADLPAELGVGSVVSSVDINLHQLGDSSASVTINLPWSLNVSLSAAAGVLTPYDTLALSLPPLLTELLKPYNLIRIRLGYTLLTPVGEGTPSVVTTLSHIVFEGVIDNISARVSEDAAGVRTLSVTISARDIFSRMSFATTEYEPPLDGWHLAEVLEHHMIQSGISPHRLVSYKWFPLGAISSYLVGENLFIGNVDAYLFYYDYPFRVDRGLDVLADAPRYAVAEGQRRMDVVRQAARLSGVALIPTHMPIPFPALDTFLNYVRNSQGYEKFSSVIGNAMSIAMLPHVPSLPPPHPPAAGGLYCQVLPVGSYSTIPTWEFRVKAHPAEGIVISPDVIYSVPVFLPVNPIVEGIFSIGWNANAWPLPTVVRLEGQRLTGQPFYFYHYDFWTEVVDRDGYRFKGYRIAAVQGRNPNIVDPLQAWLAAWRSFLQQGYFPPISCNLTVFGIPTLSPAHLVKITPPLRIVSREGAIKGIPNIGIQYWVVDSVNYRFAAGSVPTMSVTLRPPHTFLTGLFGA